MSVILLFIVWTCQNAMLCLIYPLTRYYIKTLLTWYCQQLIPSFAHVTHYWIIVVSAEASSLLNSMVCHFLQALHFITQKASVLFFLETLNKLHTSGTMIPFRECVFQAEACRSVIHAIFIHALMSINDCLMPILISTWLICIRHSSAKTGTFLGV